MAINFRFDLIMDSYKVIAIFTYPSDLAVVKALLESNDINCYVRDELTVQVHNFISDAVGGIRLEVPEEKVELAEKLLLEKGFQEFLTRINPNEEREYDPGLMQFIKSSIHFIVISVVILFLILSALIAIYG